MKKFIQGGLALALLLPVMQVNAQDYDDKNAIQGSGKVITRDVPVQSFDALDVGGVFSVQLTQGGKESVRIEADDNLQDLFEVKNEGSTLKISMKKKMHFNSKTKMKVYISFKTLKSLKLGMVGNFASEGSLNFENLSFSNSSVGAVDLTFAAQKLDLKNTSVGNVKLSGKVENAIIRNNGVGALRASDLIVQTMDIENEGVGSADVNAVKELRVKDSFLGKVKNVGNAPVKKMNRVRV
jgi:hypothetical protein